jgi:hypothetical protein
MPDSVATNRFRNAFASIQDAVCTPKVSSSKEIGVYYSASHAINISAFALLAFSNSGIPSSTTITGGTIARARVKHATTITIQSASSERATDIPAGYIAITSRNRGIARLALLACLDNAITTEIRTGNAFGSVKLTLIRCFWRITK